MLSIIDGMLGMYNSEVGVGLLSGIYGLAVLIPSLGVTVRRLHDTGRSGWCVALVPLVGAIIMVLDSQPGDNEYGPSPKAGEGTPSTAHA